MGLKDKIASKMIGMQVAAHTGIVQMMKDKCLSEARIKYREKELPTVEYVVEGMWKEGGVRASLGMVGLDKKALTEIMEYVISTLREERQNGHEVAESSPEGLYDEAGCKG